MTAFRFMIDAGAVFLAAGIFLTLYNLLLTSIEVIIRIWRKTFVSWAGRRLRDMGVIQEKSFRAQVELDWKRLVLLIAIPVIALAVHDFMLSPLVLLIGLVILIWADFQKRQIERAQINEDAEVVALQIRSLMSVDRSILNALTRVELPIGIMKHAIEQVASRLRMHQPPEQAAQAFKGLPGNVTARLSALIAHSAQLTDQTQDGLLVSLEQEAHRQKLLRSKTHQTLSLVRGTIRLLQGVVAGAISFVVLSPAWRDFFLQDVSHRVLLAVLICASALASLYFEYEVYQLSYGEGVLMDTYSLVVGFSLAIGMGMIANTVLSIFFETGRRFSRIGSHGRLHTLGLGVREQKEDKKSEDAILGLDHIPWNSLYAGAALIGLLLLAVLGPSLSSLKWGFLALPALVWLVKRYLIQQRKRFMVGQIRQFLIDVRLHMSLQGSLLLGLESIAKTTLETSAVYQSLRRRLAGSSASSGLDLLNQIAEDLKSSLFSRLVQRIQAAQQSGGVSDIDQAVTSAIEELNEEIGYQSEEQMQRLPLRITLLAMPFLLGPIVILLFYPLVDRILKTLSGVTVGGGF